MIKSKRLGSSSVMALAMLLGIAGAQAGQPVPAALVGDSPVVEGRSLIGVPYQVVRIADLDLSHSTGMTALRTRIRIAANSVCEGAEVRDIRLIRAARECRSSAFADAMDQIHVALARTEGRIDQILVASR
jgi:UrcA family protein